jgi:hypothetical protein
MKRNDWTVEEIDFLKINYEEKGLTFAANNLPRHTKNSVAKKANALNLTVNQSNYHYDETIIRNAVANSFSYKDVLRILNKVSSGTAYKCLIRFIISKNIDTSHFDPWKHNRVKRNDAPIEEYLKTGSMIGSSKLKDKLYNAGLKQRICELCGQDEWWHGKRMSLILDHINGVNNDNRIENLRIVCPNCEGTLETHCRGSKKNGPLV